MKTIFFILPAQITLMSFLFFYCQAQRSTNANLEEAKNAIAVSNKIYFQAFAKGDSSLFIDRYDANNKPVDNGKFLVLWQKTPDGWKMFRDSFNSDLDK